ncbi:semaphorin-4A-like isoform X2 [Mastacembelus armatus]|nr:semaphorin-4A-like isoform X2 [Mastacembelus armatus]
MDPSGLLLLLLLGVQSSTGSLPPPRTSFLLNSAVRPLVHFSLPDVQNTNTLLLSDDGSTLYVGAQDAVLSLDVSQSDIIALKKKVEWRPSNSDITECQRKGKNPSVDCPNYVRVLQLINSTHLYVCGSYAYSPHNAYIDTESFSMVQQGGAKGHCPFNPFQRNIGVTIEGELFAATTTDFKGVNPQIFRHFSKNGRSDVSLDSSLGLLEEPAFISSSLDPADRKLYFFFSEVGKEFNFVNKLQIARVAQVCKDDVGGRRTLQKKWTSFAKAPLLCQSPRQLPFNVLQDVFTLQPPEGSNTSDTLFYGVFTSQWSSDSESAVCVFRLQDIKTVFTGSYKTFDVGKHRWNPLQGQHSHLGKCGQDSASDSILDDIKKNFLTGGSVKPVGYGPIVVSSGQQYARVAAMRTKAANGNQYTVLFLLTESGFFHKVVLFDLGPQVIEEIQVFKQPQLMKSIILSSSKGVLYVGTSEGVTAVPLANCSIYKTCSQCVLARDPFCGWSPTQRACTSLDTSPDPIVQALENGGVDEKCGRVTRKRQDREILVPLNEAVRLECVKPSNLATLTWTSSQFENLPENLFIQSAEGKLSFFATDATFGSYQCEAEEAGYKEVVASFSVRQIASPRSVRPSADVNNDNDHKHKDDDLVTVEPEVLEESYPTESKRDDKFTTIDKEIVIKKNHSGLGNIFQHNNSESTPTSNRDVQCGRKPLSEAHEKYSYFSALVWVSILLAVCICVLILGCLYLWHQNNLGLKVTPLVSEKDSSHVNNCMETVPSLSTTEDAGPELKVVD